MQDEQRFITQADATLAKLERRLEAASELADFDFECKAGGIIEIDCAAGGKLIINRHTAAREIWLAARSGGFHFRCQEDGRWLDTRSGETLEALLARCLSEQCGEAVDIGAL